MTGAEITLHTSMFHRQGTSGTQGGAIDFAKHILLSKLVEPTEISLVSSTALDADQVYLVEGTGTTGIVESELLRLEGIVPVSTSRSFVKIMGITKQSGKPLVGNVFVSSPYAVLGELHNDVGGSSGTGFEVTGLQALATGLFSPPNDDRVYYEKFFIRNSTLDTITNFTLEEFSDPDDCIDFALDLTVNASTTSRNRTTRPGAIPVANFNGLPKTLTNFSSGDSIGVWIRIQLPPSSPTDRKMLTLKMVTDNLETLLDVITPGAPSELIANVISRRATEPVGGGLPLRFMELRGVHFVDQLFYEPDPSTFRSQFYYNTRINKLFKKIDSKPRPVWKQAR